MYAFEGIDNHGTARMTLGSNPGFTVEHRPDSLGGVSVIRGRATEGSPLLAVPFYALASREMSSQEVWAQPAGLKPDPGWRGGGAPAPRDASDCPARKSDRDCLERRLP